MLCAPGRRPSKAGRQQEALRMGESSSPREVNLSQAALAGLCNRRAQGTFLWVPPRARSAVDPPMPMLTLPSGKEALCTGLSNAEAFEKCVSINNVSFHAQEQRTAVSGN